MSDGDIKAALRFLRVQEKMLEYSDAGHMAIVTAIECCEKCMGRESESTTQSTTEPLSLGHGDPEE